MTGLLIALLSYIFPARVRVSMPEQTEAERQGAGENAMWTELGRVK